MLACVVILSVALRYNSNSTSWNCKAFPTTQCFWAWRCQHFLSSIYTSQR